MPDSDHSPDGTVLEYGRIEDAIEDRLRLRQSRLTTHELAADAGVSAAKVEATLLHENRKHACLSRVGAEAWIVEYNDRKA